VGRQIRGRDEKEREEKEGRRGRGKRWAEKGREGKVGQICSLRPRNLKFVYTLFNEYGDVRLEVTLTGVDSDA